MEKKNEGFFADDRGNVVDFYLGDEWVAQLDREGDPIEGTSCEYSYGFFMERAEVLLASIACEYKEDVTIAIICDLLRFPEDSGTRENAKDWKMEVLSDTDAQDRLARSIICDLLSAKEGSGENAIAFIEKCFE